MCQKKIFCLILACLMLIGMFDFGIVFAEDQTDYMADSSDGHLIQEVVSEQINEGNQTNELVEGTETNVPGEQNSSIDDSSMNNEDISIAEGTRPVEITVIDNYGQAISGAELCIGASYAMSDDNGVAYFDEVEIGKYLIKAVAYGYNNKATAIVVPESSNDVYNFYVVLQPNESEIETYMSVHPDDVELSEKAQYYLDLFNNTESGFSTTMSPSISESCEAGTVITECMGSIYYFAENGTYKYNPGSSVWDETVYEAMPDWRTYAGAVGVGSKIYVMGGIQNDVYSDLVDIFDTATGTWSDGRNMPTVGAYFNAHYINGRIFVGGGTTQGDPRDQYPSSGGVADSGYVFAEYNLDMNSWINRINSGTPNLCGATSAACGNKIYFTGFLSPHSEHTNLVRTYNVQSYDWEYTQGRPFADSDGRGIFGGIFVNLNDCLYYQGGSSYADDENYDTALEDNPYLFIPGTDEWIYINQSDIYEDFKMRIGSYQPVAVHENTIYSAESSYDDNGDENAYLIGFDIFKSSILKYAENTVAVGQNHVVYIDDGIVKVRGDNTYGQLGTGDNTSRNEFVSITRPWGDKKIVKVAARGYTTYAMSEDNILYAWGDNSRGQIGDRTTVSKNIPVEVMQNVTDISAGMEHAMAISGGLAYVWGSNEYRQVDDESSLPIKSTPYYLEKSDVISAGDYHTLSNMSASKGFYAFGKNDRGQLGISTARNFIMDSSITPVNMLAGGTNHSAIMLGNLLYVFGDNTYGQLGQTLPDNATYADYMINTGRTAEKVFAGANRTEYISGGNVYRAGQGYAKNYTAFEKIENTDSISELSIGDDYTLGVDGYGDIWRWGVMTDDSNFDSQKSSFSTPIKSCYEDGFVDIDSRRTQTIGITDSNKLVAWGKGYYGDGTDKETIHYYPKEIELNYGAVPKSVVRGKNLNLVIDQNGDVWGFGSNTNNPMGNLGGKVKTPTCLSGIDDVKSAAAGDGFSIFLKNDGTLWGMGLNSSGQLGQGNTIDTTTPVQITDKDDFLEVDAGDGFVVAIAEDGIYTFGANENGQLGIGSTENALSPQKLNVEFDILYEKFIDVSASTNYCLALTNKGNVYAWGRNGSGQLGIGNKTNQTTPQKVSALSDIVYINAENVQSFAIKKDGTVYGWGHGSNYQLASENTGTCQSPRQITSLKDKDIKKIVCGDGYGIAVSRNGNMYTFGSNVNGALAIYTEEAQEYISDKLDALHWLRNYMDGIGNNITENITLPTSAPNGAAIKWTSSRPGYISETGEVNRPTAYEEDSEVKLTAEIVCENDSIFKNFELTVLKDENNAVIPEIPERVRQNRYDTDSNNKNENYYFDEDDGEDTGGDIEAAGGVDLSYSPVEKARYNNIPSGQRKIPVYLDKRKKITGIIANDSGSNWGVNVISDRVFEGWCVSSEIIEPAGAEDPFYNKNVWVTNKVCSGNQDILLYTTDGKQGTFGLSYFATEPDAYEPNQYEMEAGMFWQFDNESTPTEYNSDKVKKFKANLGSRDKLATKIENLSFDSYADVDVYAVDVNVGDKITVCMEMECAQEEASKYVIGIADNMSDQENYEDEYQKSISYLTDFYYCKSFSYTNLDNTKQTLFATWVANKTERCYIHLGRRGIDGSKGEPVKYNLTTTKTANVKSDPREVKNNSWYTNDFIWINNKEIAEDITVSGGGNGMLDNQLDVDWFKYVAPETGKKKITLNGAGCFAVVRGDKMSNGGKSREYDMVKGQTYYIGVYCPDGMYDGIIKNNNPDYTFSVENSESSDSKQTAYMVLYDSGYVYESLEHVDRYFNENGEKFVYTVDFFKNYLQLIKDANVEFVISVRELDFDCNPNTSADALVDPIAYYYMSIIEGDNRLAVLADKTARQIMFIMDRMYQAYEELDVYNRPKTMPKIYIGSPHFYGNEIQNYEADAFAELYKNIFDDIYYKITTDGGVIDPENSSRCLRTINEYDIAGIYYGREDPRFAATEGQIEPDQNSVWYKTIVKMSDYADSKGKKLMWVPYTSGLRDNLRKIGYVVNAGVNSYGNSLCDIVVLQPNYYYYEIVHDVPGNDAPFVETFYDIYMSTANHAIYVDNELIGGNIPNNTLVTFQIEYDNSLITGRYHKGQATPKQKAYKFKSTYEYFKPLIDSGISFSIYAGGPNEQAFDTFTLNNRHSNRNYNTLLYPSNGHNMLYKDFYNVLQNIPAEINYFNGYLIHDITYMLLYGEDPDNILGQLSYPD